MEETFLEKRKYRRIFFDPRDNMSGQLKSKFDGNRVFSANILNLSTGGIAFRPQDDVQIEEGDSFLLVGMKDSFILELVDGEIELVVRWTAKIPGMKIKGAGAEFINFSDGQRAQIEKFISNFF